MGATVPESPLNPPGQRGRYVLEPPMDHEQAETPGLPFGELFRDTHHLRGDLRLLRRAIREGWPIPETSRAVLVERVGHAISRLDELPAGTRIRATLRAAWVLLEMEEVNRAADYAEAGLKFRRVLTRPHRRRGPDPVRPHKEPR